jgi:hypothetical protein
MFCAIYILFVRVYYFLHVHCNLQFPHTFPRSKIFQFFVFLHYNEDKNQTMSTPPRKKEIFLPLGGTRGRQTRRHHRKTNNPTSSKQNSCGGTTSTRYGITSLSDYTTENKRRTCLMENLQPRTNILSFLKENRSNTEPKLISLNDLLS